MTRSASSTKASKKQAVREKRRRQRIISTAVWSVVAISALAFAGIWLLQAIQAPVGESIPIPPEYETHIEEGTPPGPYPSNPPAGGVHYASTLEAGFYDESDLVSLSKYPEGSLVHNLEHGYVIFWYNCAVLDQNGCSALKEGIQQVITDAGEEKLIAFPWASLDIPLAMTSWGRLQRFEAFNSSQAHAFITSNLNKAPESNAP